MAKKNGKERRPENGKQQKKEPRLHPETKRSIWAIVFLGVAVVLILAGIERAGPAGEALFAALSALLGWGYFALLAVLLVLSGVFLFSDRQRIVGLALVGAVLAVLAVLGLIDLTSPGRGGWLGLVLGSLKYPFGEPAAATINVVALIVGALVTMNLPLKVRRGEKEQRLVVTEPPREPPPQGAEQSARKEPEPAAQEHEEQNVKIALPFAQAKRAKKAQPKFTDYVPPPLDLLSSTSEKPTTGDLRANANIVKRTLESFGIPVEMGEINIGPKVTRYTLKPAEGVKLSRITALNQDLALALAAHPIRIEAPIPGKSLVGIEVPNKAAALVRLGSLMHYPDFQSVGLLGFALGRDVTGEPIFANLEKMPHLLIAGATGSGKSVAIHTLVLSLLYKNSPATLKFVMIDPKRVELSVYQNIPHLVSPVVTETKKSIGVFRWALSEMDRRYELLEGAGSRDIVSYNARLRAKGASDGQENLPAGRQVADEDLLPFIVIIVDELADLMATYGREVEGSIVRLAQMARATGIHLVLSTQRPSVEIITGLIKANITGRVALQVASQVDSRTILDTAGAEKLLGGGDLLYVSAELSKPKRIQGSYVTEEEINRVASFIREHNAAVIEEAKSDEVEFPEGANGEATGGNGESRTALDGDVFDDYLASGDDDTLYDAAVQVVAEAQKASASLLQRRLKVGYARAARLLDLMEEKGVVGPGDGAKPRDVFVEKPAPE